MAISKVSSKKLLIAFDSSEDSTKASDFLAPIKDSTGLFFLGLRSKRPSENGVMVYVGRPVSVNDVFAKLVDSGRKVEEVNQTLEVLEALSSNASGTSGREYHSPRTVRRIALWFSAEEDRQFATGQAHEPALTWEYRQSPCGLGQTSKGFPAESRATFHPSLSSSGALVEGD